MIDYKGTKIVGVDMGYGNMKTAKTHFPTALREYPDKPTFPGDLLILTGNTTRSGRAAKLSLSARPMTMISISLLLPPSPQNALSTRYIQETSV